MMLAWGLLAAALGGPPHPCSSPAPDTESEACAAPLVVVIDRRLDIAPELREELLLRLGDRVWSPSDSSPRPTVAFAWMTVQPLGPDQFDVQLIVSDGRLFSREVGAEHEQRARVVAGLVANMLDAIENNRLAPLRTGVVVPPEAIEQPPPVAAEPMEQVEPVEEPEPAEVPQPSSPDPSPVEPSTPQPAPQWWMGVVGGGGATFGVGPPTDVTGVTGVGGGLGAQWIHTSGVVVGLDVRGLGWRPSNVPLTRMRVVASAGYAWRPGRFELLTTIGPMVETVWVGVD
ncbi:MAG: hypothetical protein K0V04_35530, partial [Deltaproteobacteria bacterium]|nr:hypothetical protein [Deltaproteobacteria bacterium]